MTQALLVLALIAAPSAAGSWRATLDLAGGGLHFGLEIRATGDGLRGRVCNGSACIPVSSIEQRGDSLFLKLADYAATISVEFRRDSLVGNYFNVGRLGPRLIPFRAGRGRWPVVRGPRPLLGSWDATFTTAEGRKTPRVFLFRNGRRGLEGSVMSNTGDYGLFQGSAQADSFAFAHFDGSFIYLITGRQDGDTLRGIFHAGLRTQTPFTAVRSSGAAHLAEPTAMTQADTTEPFRFQFPSVDGAVVSSTDSVFRGKVVLLDIFGTWCPTCHDAAPLLVSFWHEYHARGLEIVSIAYEVTPDSGVNAPLVRRYREKFAIPFPLLLGGTAVVEETAATLPQLQGFVSYPTTVFLGRDGRVRRVYAGFYGPATGARNKWQIQQFRTFIEQLLEE